MSQSIVQKVLKHIQDLATNPIIKSYLDEQIREQVFFERLLGNDNALIGDLKHNTVGDLVTYIHAPKVARIGFRNLISRYGEAFVFEAFKLYAKKQLEDPIHVA